MHFPPSVRDHSAPEDIEKNPVNAADKKQTAYLRAPYYRALKKHLQ